MSISDAIRRVNHSVDLERAAETENDLKEKVRTWSIVSKSIPCWVQESNSKMFDEQGRLVIAIVYSVFFDADPGILEGDRLDYNGIKLLVVGVINSGGVDKVWLVDARRTV